MEENPSKKNRNTLECYKKATRLLADGCVIRHGCPDPNLDGPGLFSVLPGRKKNKLSLRRRIPGEPNLPGRTEFLAGL